MLDFLKGKQRLVRRLKSSAYGFWCNLQDVKEKYVRVNEFTHRNKILFWWKPSFYFGTEGFCFVIFLALA